jgi:hypothetical protein
LGAVSPAKIFGQDEICNGDHVVLPSGRRGVVVEPPVGQVIPLDALVRLNDPALGELAVRWVRADLLKVFGDKARG